MHNLSTKKISVWFGNQNGVLRKVFFFFGFFTTEFLKLVSVDRNQHITTNINDDTDSATRNELLLSMRRVERSWCTLQLLAAYTARWHGKQGWVGGGGEGCFFWWYNNIERINTDR